MGKKYRQKILAICKDFITYMVTFFLLLIIASFFAFMACLFLSGHIFWGIIMLMTGVFILAVINQLYFERDK